jgi:hypothetical protein
VHQGDVRIQEPDNRDLADELGPLEVCFKESLVERGDLLPSFEVRSMVSDALACWAAAIVLTFRTLFRTFAAIFEELPVEGGSGAIYGLFSCPITHCCYTIFPLITTSCQL